jgi:hypothetical protein
VAFGEKLHQSIPPKELLDEMVTVMEGIIREHYVTGPMLETARTRIPPRPPRQKSSPPTVSTTDDNSE